MKLRIGFSKSRSVLKCGSTIIRLYEGTPFSHAYVRYLDLMTDIEMIAQASHSYVNEMNAKIFEEENMIIDEFEVLIDDLNFIHVLEFIKTNLGKKYSKLQLLLIVLRDFFGTLPFIKSNHDQEFICSEFAARIAETACLLKGDIDFDYISPRNLHDELEKQTFLMPDRIIKLTRK